jgi:hypothetical protein
VRFRAALAARFNRELEPCLTRHARKGPHVDVARQLVQVPVHEQIDRTIAAPGLVEARELRGHAFETFAVEFVCQCVELDVDDVFDFVLEHGRREQVDGAEQSAHADGEQGAVGQREPERARAQRAAEVRRFASHHASEKNSLFF